MEARREAVRRRTVARLARSSRRDGVKDNNQSVDEAARESLKLELEDPSTPPPQYEQDEDEGDRDTELESHATRSHAGTSVSSQRRENGSIYDYLDALETESARQLPSIRSRCSLSSRTSSHALSQRGNTSVSQGFAWEDGDSSGRGSKQRPSPGSRSYRSLSSHSSPNESDNSHAYVVGIKEKLATITIELHDKSKTVELLKQARKKDKAKTKQLLAAAEDKLQQQLQTQQRELDKQLEAQVDFAQGLVSDKTALAKRCEELVADVQKANAAAAREAERFKLKLKDAKERWAVQEKVRREQWLVKKTEEVKKSTVAALEPDIQAILAKGKADLAKQREDASDERRKLQAQMDKERDMALQRLQADYERKLVAAREKERAKLMTRLDAADAELQQQLSTQRRRLQDEAETTRSELQAELRAAKLAHAQELEELKAQETHKQQLAGDKLQKDKQELRAKYEAELLALREQTSVECEQFKTQMAAKLREQAEREKQTLEQQMLQTRDAKIELVIEKLQEESRLTIARVERKMQKKLEQQRVESERKLQHTAEMEGVWMAKNRELHAKLSALESTLEELRRQKDELSQEARRADDNAGDLARELHEERRQHQAAVAQWEQQRCALQTDCDYAQQQQSAESAAMRDTQATMETHFQQQLQQLRDEHESALANLHERIKATVARKDQNIRELRDELHLLQAQLEKSRALIEEQRQQLFCD